MNFIQSILLITIISFSTTLMAQNKKPKKTLEQKSIEMTAKLHKEIKLTKEQIKEIRKIYLVYLEEKKALEDKIALQKKERNTKIDALLTEDQKKKKENSKKKKKK